MNETSIKSEAGMLERDERKQKKEILLFQACNKALVVHTSLQKIKFVNSAYLILAES